jgi:hypothetical protein
MQRENAGQIEKEINLAIFALVLNGVRTSLNPI